MELTEEQKEEIEALAALRFSADVIAVIVELPIREFLTEYGYKEEAVEKIAKQRERQTEVYRIIERGRLKEEADIRKSICEMAKAGSSPAQAYFRQICEEEHIKELTYVSSQ